MVTAKVNEPEKGKETQQKSEDRIQEDTQKEKKIVIGNKEFSEKEIADLIEKRDNLESEYNRKFIELSNAQKELEPLIQLQQHLAQHPDQAQMIAKILEGEELTVQEKEKFETDIPEVKKLKDELDALKKNIEDFKSVTEYQKAVEESKQFFTSEISKLSQKYDDLEQDVLIAKLMSIPDIDRIPKEKLVDIMDKIAYDIDKRFKEKKDAYLQEYLSKKDKQIKDTKGETTGGSHGSEKEKIDVKISDGSAKKKAIDYLNQLIRKK